MLAARYLRTRGGFRRVTALTHRTDSLAPVKAEARTVLRRRIAEAAQTGIAVVIALLLSAGGIEAKIARPCRPLLHRPHTLKFNLCTPVLPASGDRIVRRDRFCHSLAGGRDHTGFQPLTDEIRLHGRRSALR